MTEPVTHVTLLASDLGPGQAAAEGLALRYCTPETCHDPRCENYRGEPMTEPPKMPVYEIEKRGDTYAVVRTGVRGGARLIAVYPAKHQAKYVAATLNSWAGVEL